MKKVIDGKVFNTETSESIASASYSSCGDFHYWFEELFLSRNGQFFLYGKGGPLSRYSVDSGNNTISGSINIILLTREEALQWCQDNDVDPDIICQYFDVVDG